MNHPRVLIGLLALLLPTTFATADPLAAARAEFQAAMVAASGAAPDARAVDSQRLQEYPLYPYLQASRLQRRLSDPAADAEIRAFLTEFDEQPVARSLRRGWLMELAQRRQWTDFLAVYREETDETAAARCTAVTARIALGQTDGLAEVSTALYLSPKSLPPVCDPAIEWLGRQGLLTPDLIERRARLALVEGEAGLARYLARSLPATRATPIEQWAALIAEPRASVDALIATPGRSVETPALLDGWSRAARADPDGMASRFAALTAARGMDASAAGPFALAVALPLSWSRSPRSLEFFANVQPADFDERGHEWRVRAALWAGDWPLVQRAIAAMPAELAAENRWRYWAARSAEQLGDKESARRGYEAVLPTDNWYAALSAVHLGQRFTPTQQPIPRDEALLQRIAADPGLVRTRELILVDMDGEAGREFRAATDVLPPDQQAQAVRLASGWGWHLQAIAAAARQGIFNDYELLYPRPFDAEVRQAARAERLPESLIYAVIRQESLFRVDARSSADALGLMQLLPETARRTAAAAGLDKPSRGDLLVPAVNIRLGSAFLRRLLDRADEQWPIAIAGYNAGPGAARRWLPDARMDTDVWVENIPFNETRAYVQRVHWHSLVFAWLAQAKPQDAARWLDGVRRETPAEALR